MGNASHRFLGHLSPVALDSSFKGFCKVSFPFVVVSSILFRLLILVLFEL